MTAKKTARPRSIGAVTPKIAQGMVEEALALIRAEGPRCGYQRRAAAKFGLKIHHFNNLVSGRNYLDAIDLDVWVQEREKAVAAYRDALEEHGPTLLSPEDRFEERRSSRRLAARVKQLEGELAAVAHEQNVLDTLKELARETAPALPPAPKLYRPPKTDSPIEETAVQMLSDWHCYEEVKASRTRGFAFYNPPEMLRRLQNLVAAHLMITRRLIGGGWHFPELWLPLLGDFVSGSIHSLEKHSHGSNVVMSAYNAAWVLAQVVRDLSAHYPKTHITAVVGNHGRLPDDRFVPSKDPTRNWDMMIYLLAAEMLREQETVQFRISPAYSMQVQVRGYNFLLNHGDKIRRWMGIPWYGIERWDVKSTALEAQRGNVIHYRLLGQFHKSAQLPSQVGEKFVNGSVVGANEYAVDEVTESDPPKQLMFGVHQDFGATHRWPLLLTVDRSPRPTYDVNRLPLLTGEEDAQMGVAPIWKL